jgi:hypothetical protein
VVLGLERSTASHEFINSDSQRPDINFLVIPSPNVDFRSKIEVSSDDSEHVPPDSSRKSLLRYSKIYDLYFSLLLIIENIFRLDVSVADIMLM